MVEKEYIERGAVIAHLNNIWETTDNWYDEDTPESPENMIRFVESIPAADVVEVKHGEWIIKTNYKTPVSHAYIRKEKLYICPYCGKDYRQHMNFCGNCGAKMNGGKHETD